MNLDEDTSLYGLPNFQSSMMVPRSNMPQISKEQLPSFLDWLYKRTGKPHTEHRVYAPTLKPTQSQISTEKVASIGPTMHPIIVSNDNYVLDGHHRWVANVASGNPQAIYKLPTDVAESLKLMNEYPGSSQESMNEEDGGGGGEVVASGDAAPTVSIGNQAMDNEVVIPRKRKGRKELIGFLERINVS